MCKTRKYGFQEVIEKSEEPLLYYWHRLDTFIVASILTCLVIIGIAGIMKADAERNLMLVNQVENQKIEQIQLDRMVKTNR